MSWPAELRSLISGEVLTDNASCAAVSTDFGRVVHRFPAAVVRPRSTADVATTVKFAVQHQLRVATRGAGHSQSGQSLSEHIAVDVSALAGVTQLDRQTLTVSCAGGTSWRSLLAKTEPLQLSPPVLTNNLDVSAGGTLSTAGLGVASWRSGTQADHCLELEVVTGEGEIVRCSREHHPELFDAVRGGMGQFGVITEATLRLRRHEPRYRTFCLLYDDLTFLLEDLKTIMATDRFRYIESWAVPCPQGFRRVGNERVPFAQWFYPLHLTIETADQPPAPMEYLSGLHFYRLVHTEDGPIGDFFRRLDPLFAIWKRIGFWDYAHPWMETILAWQSCQLYITQVLAQLPPQTVAGGHILLWPARGNASSVPLFMRPSSETLMGFGVLPAVPPHLLDEALPRLRQASAASVMMGGKRYLSGWVVFDNEQWKAHYGPLWPRVQELKKRFDPKHVLNPGFILFD